MSEDEIITKAKDIAKRGIDPNEYIEDLIMRETIQGLLDLYQQEKEKNSKIQKYVKSNEWAEDYEKSSCRTKILRILEE